MTVTHCICFDRSFTELKALAEKHGARTVEDLQQWVAFGEQCKLCHPFVEAMLKKHSPPSNNTTHPNNM